MKQNELFKATIIAIVIHFLLALIFLKLTIFKEILLSELVILIDTATIAGTSFIFGYLGGGDVPFYCNYSGNYYLNCGNFFINW